MTPVALGWPLTCSHNSNESSLMCVCLDRGGFRTGKRPCMRRVIEYIASDFRKDKFWLRRVEPSKRQYQVMVAVDDSASMVFNHSKQVGLFRGHKPRWTAAVITEHLYDIV